MVVFLRWWLVFWLSIAGAAVAGIYGFYPYLWRADASYISWACLGVYALMTAFVGQITNRARLAAQKPPPKRTTIAKPDGVMEHLPLCWYAANCLMALGLIGTLVGFLIIPEAIKGGLTDPATVLTKAADGLSTAGVTTIVGLACSMLLKLQLINLQYLLRRG